LSKKPPIGYAIGCSTKELKHSNLITESLVPLCTFWLFSYLLDVCQFEEVLKFNFDGLLCIYCELLNVLSILCMNFENGYYCAKISDAIDIEL
jgi:hypothetical protein